jgi:hypothetical protein
VGWHVQAQLVGLADHDSDVMPDVGGASSKERFPLRPSTVCPRHCCADSFDGATLPSLSRSLEMNGSDGRVNS